jgi:hypothetical protein
MMPMTRIEESDDNAFPAEFGILEVQQKCQPQTRDVQVPNHLS